MTLPTLVKVIIPLVVYVVVYGLVLFAVFSPPKSSARNHRRGD